MPKGIKANWTFDLAVAKIKDLSVNGIMPTSPQLRELGLKSLWSYMSTNGGAPKFAKAAGLELTKKAKEMLNAIDWTDELAIAKLKKVAVNGMMPSARQLEKLQLVTLWRYMTKNGGVAKFAEAAGLQLSKIAKGKINAIDWTDDLAIAKIKELSVNGMMPTKAQLSELQLESLWNYMRMNGGIAKFAKAAGLHLSKQSQAYFVSRANKHTTKMTIAVRNDLPKVSNKELNSLLRAM